LLIVQSQAQQQISDQDDGDLNAHNIFAGANEVFDLQGLLDPFKEQFNGPMTLVKVSDLARRSPEVIA